MTGGLMQNNFGSFHASGHVSFTDNSQTYNEAVIDAETRELLWTRAMEVSQQVDAALPRLEPELAIALRSATDEVTAELRAPDPARGRLGTAVARLSDVASGAGSLAGLAASVQSLITLLGGGV